MKCCVSKTNDKDKTGKRQGKPGSPEGRGREEDRRTEEIKEIVRKAYTETAEKGSMTGSGPAPADGASAASCCGHDPVGMARMIGYKDEEIRSVPEGANLGLGCGSPVALASLREGEKVIDLGSGAGFDLFLSAQRVGPAGKAVGIDMTPKMIEKARENARKGNFTNVEFRLGDIEKIPAEDGEFDVAISNCVINLAPDKQKVFNETYRVLKAGGRMFVSDIVFREEPPPDLRNNVELLAACVSGASTKEDYLGYIRKAGFQRVRIVKETPAGHIMTDNDPLVQKAKEELGSSEFDDLSGNVVSIEVEAHK